MIDKNNMVQTASASKLKQQAESINVTPLAAKHLAKNLQGQANAIGIRFGVNKAGCSGLKYFIEFTDSKQENDHVFPFHDDLAVYVDEQSWPSVKGTTIDLVTEGLNDKIIFRNPRAEDACGCGESFSLANDEK